MSLQGIWAVSRKPGHGGTQGKSLYRRMIVLEKQATSEEQEDDDDDDVKIFSPARFTNHTNLWIIPSVVYRRVPPMLVLVSYHFPS
jgi:hypothetical protein